MNVSLHNATWVLIPADTLEKTKRKWECQDQFQCEITGRDAKACVDAISQLPTEIQKVNETTYRIHKQTEHLTRFVVALVEKWKLVDPSGRHVSAEPIAAEQTFQVALDAANSDLNGNDVQAGAFQGGVALKSAGLSGTLGFDANGSCTSISLGTPESKGSDSSKELDQAKAQIEEAQKEIAALKAELESQRLEIEKSSVSEKIVVAQKAKKTATKTTKRK